MYKQNEYYVYQKNNLYYMCESRGNTQLVYDLNKENDQKRFYSEWCYRLREKTILEEMFFSKFSMYDIIVNFKNNFKI